MSDRIKHHCGLVLIHSSESRSNLAELAEEIAHHLGNRGNDAAGISMLTPYGLQYEHREGSVSKRILREKAKSVCAYSAIIHNRYRTTGSKNATQPFVYGTDREAMSIAHNGTVEMKPLETFLQEKSVELSNIGSDSDLIGRAMYHLMQTNRMAIHEAVTQIWGKLSGAHNIVLQRGDGSSAAWRDAAGKHPLFHTTYEGMQIVASEDNAIVQTLGNQARIEEVPPGSLMLFSQDGSTIVHTIEKARLSYCIFEWIYFLKRLSSLGGARADTIRTRAGEELAKLDAEMIEEMRSGGHPPIVVAVPQTALGAANGYKDQANLRGIDAILRNPSIPRTFIAQQGQRETNTKQKYDINYSLLNGQNIILIDDSIVRGNTLRRLINMIKDNSSPLSIHVRSSFPPVFSPCFQGIDMSTVDELLISQYREFLASGESITRIEERIAKKFGINSLRYLPLSLIGKVVQLPENTLCSGCTRAEYDTPEMQRLYEIQLKNTK